MRHLLIFTVRNSSFYRCLSVQEGGGYPGRKGASRGVICPEGVSIPEGVGLSPATLVFTGVCLSMKGWVSQSEYPRVGECSRGGYIEMEVSI